MRILETTTSDALDLLRFGAELGAERALLRASLAGCRALIGGLAGALAWLYLRRRALRHGRWWCWGPLPFALPATAPFAPAFGPGPAASAPSAARDQEWRWSRAEGPPRGRNRGRDADAPQGADPLPASLDLLLGAGCRDDN
jgi:hypothetical protein